MRSRLVRIQQAISSICELGEISELISNSDNRRAIYNDLGYIKHICFGSINNFDSIERIQSFMISFCDLISAEISESEEKRSIYLKCGNITQHLEERQKEHENLHDSIPDIISVPSDSTNPQQPPTPRRRNTHGNNRQELYHHLENDDHTAVTAELTPSASLETTSRSFE